MDTLSNSVPSFNLLLGIDFQHAFSRFLFHSIIITSVDNDSDLDSLDNNSSGHCWLFRVNWVGMKWPTPAHGDGDSSNPSFYHDFQIFEPTLSGDDPYK